jgi:RNA polymerase sigma-70 factor (ECF subfamily)
MAETPKILIAGGQNAGPVMAESDVNAWFVREVLPLEKILMQFLRHHWPNTGEIEDLRQEVYVRVHEAAQKKIPEPAKPFVFTVARNLVINRVKREQIVPIEAVADLDELGIAVEAPSPDRAAIARDELRRLQTAIDRLPPRAREVVILARLEGLSGREIAVRLGIGESTVSEHMTSGLRALANMLNGDLSDFGGGS